MKTSALISALSVDAEVFSRPRLGWRLALAATVGLSIAGLLVALIFGVRADYLRALPATVLKSLFGLTAALVLLPLVVQLARPNVGVRPYAIGAAAFVALCALVASAQLLAAHSLAPLRLTAGFPECLGRVPLLAFPIAVILFAVAKRFAPTRLTLAGAAIGAFSGGIAIIAYAWFCPVDSVAYVVVWYLLAILVCAVAGALIGPRALRWT